MDDGEPTRDSLPGGGSLAGQIGALLRSGGGHPNRELAAAIAISIALGPLCTLAGAKWIAATDRREVQRLRDELDPRLAAERESDEARGQLARTAARPMMGVTLEALARGIPADSTIARVERSPQGFLEVDVSTPDPDRLRAAIRRDPALSRLRDTSQRQSDAMMIVTLRETSQ